MDIRVKRKRKNRSKDRCNSWVNWWNEFSNVEVRRVRWNDLWNDILGWVKWNELWNDEVWWIRWNNALEQWSTYMRRFQKFLRYTSVSTSCLILDSIFCKNTLVRSIRKKSSNWSEICNLYSLAIILTKFHRFFNAPFVTIFSLILLEHPVLLLLYSYMQNLPNRSLSSHILFVVFVVVQGSQKTRVGKFGLVSKTLSIGIKS